MQGFQIDPTIAPRQDAERAISSSGRFEGQIRSYIDKAKPGDQYLFQDIKARCPGDNAGREINSISFTIK